MTRIVYKNRVRVMIFASVCWIGCSTTQTVSPSFLFLDSTKSVTLYLIDGRIISFTAGNYSAHDTGDSCYVKGNGIIYKNGSYKHVPFSGTVNFRDIKDMKFYEPPPQWQTTPLIIAASIIVALIVFLSTANFKT